MRARDKVAAASHSTVRSRRRNTSDSEVTKPSSNGVNSESDGSSGSKAVCVNSSPRIQDVMKRFAQYAYEQFVQGKPVLEHLPILVQYNVATALAGNAAMLGVSDEWYTYDAISPFNKQGPNILGPMLSSKKWPPSMHPTPLQVAIEHHPWIDLFPTPRMRDNFLRAIEHPELCDEDELCRDLCQYGDPNEKATLIVWGTPWDPMSWEVSEKFLRKWGWMLIGCWEVIDATNHWRQKRGEKRLTMKDVFGALEGSVEKARLMGASF